MTKKPREHLGEVPPLPELPPVDHFSYADLYDGTVTCVVMYVRVSGLRADPRLRDKPDALYELTTPRFRDICDGIATAEGAPDVCGRDIAERCDKVSGNESWMRLSAGVADWIDADEPMGYIFATIG